MRIRIKTALAGCALLVGCSAPAPTVGTQAAAVTVDEGHGRHDAKTTHVLLLSIDGFHDFDLTNYVASHPNSALASLVARGTVYSQAYATAPSDSFPATLAMTTGGSPSSTGIYYDASWDDNLSPPGSNCSTRGTAVTYKENINFTATSALATDINPATLPRDPDNGCAPVYPHSYLKVNTIYEVIKAAGMRTAATDKHPAYEMLNGPSGTGLDDFYGPEFNAGKKNIAQTMANDDLRLTAVLHQLDGCDHTRRQLQRRCAGDPRHELPGREHRAEVLGLRRRGRHDAGQQVLHQLAHGPGSRPAAGDGPRRRVDPADAEQASTPMASRARRS